MNFLRPSTYLITSGTVANPTNAYDNAGSTLDAVTYAQLQPNDVSTIQYFGFSGAAVISTVVFARVSLSAILNDVGGGAYASTTLEFSTDGGGTWTQFWYYSADAGTTTFNGIVTTGQISTALSSLRIRASSTNSTWAGSTSSGLQIFDVVVSSGTAGLQTSGAISLADVQSEFTGANPIGINEYYAGAADGYVSLGTIGYPSSTPTAIPSGGPIALANFYGAARGSSSGATVTVVPSTLSINEGSTLTFTVNTTGILDGTVLYWRYAVTGTVSDPSRFASVPPYPFTIVGGSATLTFPILANLHTDGTTYFGISIRTSSDFVHGLLTTSPLVTINDTSQTLIPTYSITPRATSVNEGSSVVFDIVTTNVTDGTTLSWSTMQTSGNITAADFVDNTLSGIVTIMGNAATLTRDIANDNLTEGPEVFYILLSTTGTGGAEVARSVDVTINDTSLTPFVSGTWAFTTSGTWTPPAGVTSVTLLMIGGGGGGGGAVYPSLEGAGGGGAGGMRVIRNYPVSPGTQYQITIGAGGAGRSGYHWGMVPYSYTVSGNTYYGTQPGWVYTDQADGIDGGTTTFNNVYPTGGGGGGGGNQAQYGHWGGVNNGSGGGAWAFNAGFVTGGGVQAAGTPGGNGAENFYGGGGGGVVSGGAIGSPNGGAGATYLTPAPYYLNGALNSSSETAVSFGGGGGGGGGDSTSGGAAVNGGGAGGNNASNGSSGQLGTGGGGGGCGGIYNLGLIPAEPTTIGGGNGGDGAVYIMSESPLSGSLTGAGGNTVNNNHSGIQYLVRTTLYLDDSGDAKFLVTNTPTGQAQSTNFVPATTGWFSPIAPANFANATPGARYWVKYSATYSFTGDGGLGTFSSQALEQYMHLAYHTGFTLQIPDRVGATTAASGTATITVSVYDYPYGTLLATTVYTLNVSQS